MITTPEPALDDGTDGRPPDGGRPALRAAVSVARPLLVCLAALALQLLMLAWLGDRPDWLRAALTPWDNTWYVQIAEQGYPHGFSYDANGVLTGNTLAFFPLYPAAVRLVAAVTGEDGRTASVVAAWLASAGAAVLLERLGSRLWGRRAGLVTVAVVFTQPMAVALWIGYSESLFLLLVAGCLLAAHRRAWLTAGVCALLAGLTRSTGLALSLALLVAAVPPMWRERRVRWRPVTGVLLGCAGVPAYLAWVGLRVGQPTAWLVIQRAGWNTAWDWGAATWQFLDSTLRRGSDWVPVSIALLLVVLAALCASELLHRPWPPLAVYGLLVFALTVGQTNYYHSKPRLLVPALLTLAPVVRALAGRLRTAWPVLAVFALAGTWFGAYMLTDWHYAI